MSERILTGSAIVLYSSAFVQPLEISFFSARLLLGERSSTTSVTDAELDLGFDLLRIKGLKLSDVGPDLFLSNPTIKFLNTGVGESQQNPLGDFYIEALRQLCRLPSVAAYLTGEADKPEPRELRLYTDLKERKLVPGNGDDGKWSTVNIPIGYLLIREFATDNQVGTVWADIQLGDYLALPHCQILSEVGAPSVEMKGNSLLDARLRQLVNNCLQTPHIEKYTRSISLDRITDTTPEFLLLPSSAPIKFT